MTGRDVDAAGRKIIEAAGYGDAFGHGFMNVIGSRKLTYFLGKYLTENYDIKGSHSDKTVKRWDLCAQKTDKVLEECAKDTKNKIGAQYFELSAYSK